MFRPFASSPRRSAQIDAAQQPGGFLVCAVEGATLAVCYADLRAVAAFGGRPLVGMPLADLLDPRDGSEWIGAVSARAVDGAWPGAGVGTVCRTRSARGHRLRLQPVHDGDPHRPRILCFLEPAAASVIEPAGRPSEPSGRTTVDVAAFVTGLAKRLTDRLPGSIEVIVTLPAAPVPARVDEAALEELVGELLAMASPPDPLRYTVRLAARSLHDAEVLLTVGLVGCELARIRLDEGSQERLTALGGVVSRELGPDLGLRLPGGEAVPSAGEPRSSTGLRLVAPSA